MSVPKIFLIEEDNDSRRLFRENLKDAGYKVALAIDAEDAFERVENEGFNADLVVINLLGKTIEKTLEIGRNVCRAGNINAPIVVIAQKYGADLEGKNERVSDQEYVAYLADGEQLLDLLSRLSGRN